MTHPLTDEVCELIADTEDRLFTSVEKDNMRAAWDAGVQAVIDFLESESCSDYSGTLYYPLHGDDEYIADAIHRAMRPTAEEQEESSDEIKPGDYVHAAVWSDFDPNDPWCIGFVYRVIHCSNGTRYTLCDEDGNVLEHGREYSHAKHITPEEGAIFLEENQ